jgi:hypothetical protein
VGSTEELAEFQALSAKVSERRASADETSRWRDLRARLAPPPTPQPPAPQLPRQHARTTTRKLKIELTPVSALHATFTEEVSPGGVKLRLPMLVEPGAPMVVRLELGPPGPILVNAKVAWCRRDGGHFLAGLSFVGLRDDERERIEAWTALTGPR